MLLARVAAELRAVDALSKYLLPVRFMEESHEIFNLADFWLETLFHLARASVAHDSEMARDLRETHAALAGARWQERALAEHARAAVLAAADRLGKRLVLMVENMQGLCRNVDDDFGWQLRRELQSEPQIMLLASAASRFKGLDDATQPFFELFRIIDLEPLATDECRRLWHAVSGDAVTRREIRPLKILTGGSPRLLVIVAAFAQHRSLRQLMEELVTLIDEHTEYFRGHLEVLGKAERRVYLAVIDLWQPSRPGEIAARARMDVRVVSTMLGRLLDRGAVTMNGSGRKRLYSAAERLYTIYYKLRRERDEAAVVRNLIHFMALFYSEAELFELPGRLTTEGPHSRPSFAQASTGRSPSCSPSMAAPPARRVCWNTSPARPRRATTGRSGSESTQRLKRNVSRRSSRSRTRPSPATKQVRLGCQRHSPHTCCSGRPPRIRSWTSGQQPIAVCDEIGHALRRQRTAEAAVVCCRCVVRRGTGERRVQRVGISGCSLRRDRQAVWRQRGTQAPMVGRRRAG